MADHLELVRAPAVLTVLGDTLAGSAAAGHPWTVRRAALPLASACLYSGGMALNDWADRELDATERPERPIPSGRVTPRRALTVATGLGAAGIALAAVGGGVRSLAMAVPLATGVWLYDAVLKDGPAGPATMATCRGLDVLMGAGAGRLRAAAPAAFTVAAHTAGVTWLSRGEVHGSTVRDARAVAAVSAGVTVATALAALGSVRAAGRTAGTGRTAVAGSVASALGSRPAVAGRRPVRTAARAGALAATVAYAAAVLPPQLAAARRPTADLARAATGAGIRAMIPLQAAWAARSGSPAAAAVIGVAGAAGVLLRRGTRAVSET
ncbi:UbiA family prenyltransferase [Cellulomonas denverensis]|uniref:UbiA family prenyltransferase n=1 Tax=Cellulomonas denverensis TaxID=264297 RepID=A0A7X6KXI2_9CELL|nr:UbiA family prenyltransferase [Cellulomonas denverensis]